MKNTLLLLSVALLSSVNAYSGPYAVWTEYYYAGCTGSSTQNYLSDVYLYRADGSCFTPSGGLSSSGSWSYTINVLNSTTVRITEYYDTSCSSYWGTTDYPIGVCPSNDYYLITILQDMPPNQYWLDQGYVGYYGPWETVMAVDYYESGCQSNEWIDKEIIGWEECYTGSKFYCQDFEMHYDGCTDTTTCDSGCIEIYQPLSDACTATSNAPTWWSLYIDDASSYYQATCAGDKTPSPTPSASPIPDDDSSSDGPSEGVCLLFVIIALLVGIIIGLLVGFAIYSKINSKKRVMENGYVQLPPYPMPLPMYPTAHQ